jgi:uncharacterized protein YndB with AHSA1/START domain
MTEDDDSTVSPRRDPSDGSFAVVVENDMMAAPDAIYRAWTQGFDTWFAAPGQIRMVAQEGEPFWFDVVFENERHPHHGRLMRLDPDRLIEMTWVTGKNGTWGAATLVTVELVGQAAGTRIRLTHRGFYDEPAARQHAEAWPHVLEHLDDVLATT